jgi:opacity protein-like surface antigen
MSVVLLIATSACATANGPQAAKAPAEAAPTKPNFYADLALGGGTYKHDIKSGPDGSTDGGYFRLRAEYVGEAAMGGGFALEGEASDDELFADDGSPDAEGSTSDLYLYFVGVATESRQFRLPIRVGPYLHNVSIDEDSSGTEIDWDGFGLRGEVEPEFWLVREPGFSFGFVGDLSAGLHKTNIDASIPGISDEFDGDGFTFGAGLGVQALFGDHVTTKLGYVYRATSEDESDVSGSALIVGQDVSFSGIALQVGVRF